MRLYVVRHPQTEGNANGILQGHHDTPLTSEGRALAQRMALWLRSQDIVGIHTSDLGRCRETSGIINSQLHVPVQETRALREQDFGAFNGVERTIVERSFEWRDPDAVPPGGESLARVGRRVHRYLERLRGAGPLLIVTHDGCLRTLLSAGLGVPVSDPACSRSAACVAILELDTRGVRCEEIVDIDAKLVPGMPEAR